MVKDKWWNSPAHHNRRHAKRKAQIKANLDWLASADERNKEKRQRLLQARKKGE